jgi:hypothetical protein
MSLVEQYIMKIPCRKEPEKIEEVAIHIYQQGSEKSPWCNGCDDSDGSKSCQLCCSSALAAFVESHSEYSLDWTLK